MVTAVSRKLSPSFSGPTGSTSPVVFSSTLPLHPDLAFSGQDDSVTFGMRKQSRRDFLNLRNWGKQSHTKKVTPKSSFNDLQQFNPKMSRSNFLAFLAIATVMAACHKDMDIEPIDPGNGAIPVEQIDLKKPEDYLDWKNVIAKPIPNAPGVLIQIPLKELDNIKRKSGFGADSNKLGLQEVFQSPDKPIKVQYETFTTRINKNNKQPENVHIRSTSANAAITVEDGKRYLTITTPDGTISKGSRLYVESGLFVKRSELVEGKEPNTNVVEFPQLNLNASEFSPPITQSLECDMAPPSPIQAQFCLTSPQVANVSNLLTPAEAAVTFKNLTALKPEQVTNNPNESNKVYGAISGRDFFPSPFFGAPAVGPGNYSSLPGPLLIEFNQFIDNLANAVTDNPKLSSYIQKNKAQTIKDEFASYLSECQTPVSPQNPASPIRETFRVQTGDNNYQDGLRLAAGYFAARIFPWGEDAFNLISNPDNRLFNFVSMNYKDPLSRLGNNAMYAAKNPYNNNRLTLFVDLQGSNAINKFSMPILATLAIHEATHQNPDKGTIGEEVFANWIEAFTNFICISAGVVGSDIIERKTNVRVLSMMNAGGLKSSGQASSVGTKSPTNSTLLPGAPQDLTGVSASNYYDALKAVLTSASNASLNIKNEEADPSSAYETSPYALSVYKKITGNSAWPQNVDHKYSRALLDKSFDSFSLDPSIYLSAAKNLGLYYDSSTKV